jgi:hypothetical protein
VKRRLLFVVVLLSCALLAAVAVLYSGFLAAPVAGRSGAPSPFASDLDAESEPLDRQLQSTEAHRDLLERLSADLIAGRCTLPDAATVLANFSRQSKPEWLRGAATVVRARPKARRVIRTIRKTRYRHRADTFCANSANKKSQLPGAGWVVLAEQARRRLREAQAARDKLPQRPCPRGPEHRP